MNVVFLDRDGVINEFPGKGEYVTSQAAFRFIPRAKEAIRLLSERGCEIYVVSNQGCVSRGLISAADLEAMTDRMLEEVRSAEGRIDGVFYCLHQTSDACDCKKPKISLFKKALAGRPVDKRSACFIGDSREDVEAGRALGCLTVLVLSGRTKREDLPSFEPKPDRVAADLWEAATWIARNES